jgi:hypothetical protein
MPMKYDDLYTLGDPHHCHEHMFNFICQFEC